MNANKDQAQCVCSAPNCGVIIYGDDRTRVEKLRRHIGLMHSRIYCGPCNKLFPSPDATLEHYERAHRHIYCPQCKKLYESPAALQRHKEDDPYHCIHCPRTFHYSARRDEHMISAHTELRCKVCQSSITGGKNCKCELDKDARRVFKEAVKQQGKDLPQVRSTLRFGNSPDSFFTGPFTKDTPPKSPNFGKAADFSGKEWQFRDPSAKPKGSDHKPREKQQQNPNSGSSKPGRRESKPPPPPAAAKTPIVNYYALIGIPTTASHTEIIKATKKARIANHPDRFIGKNLPPHELARVTELSKCIGQACDVLENPTERALYDAKLKKEMPSKKHVHFATPDRGHAQERKPASPREPKADRQSPPKPKPEERKPAMEERHPNHFDRNRYESDRSQWPGTPPQKPNEKPRRPAPEGRDPAWYEAFGINTHRENYSSTFGGWKSGADPKFSSERYRRRSARASDADGDVEMVDADH